MLSNSSVAEIFPEKSSDGRNEHFCQWMKCNVVAELPTLASKKEEHCRAQRTAKF